MRHQRVDGRGMTVRFEEYADRYRSIRMERHDGILQLTFHTKGGSLQWSRVGGVVASEEFAQAFADIGRDPQNKVVIMTGTGKVFSGPPASEEQSEYPTPRAWDAIHRRGMLLITSLLNIDAIIVCCVNGPAYRRPEIPLLADIVLAAPEASFQDSAHFANRKTPGDGVNFVIPLLMGLNRARYFLLTGQTLTATDALEIGLVNEIVPREQLLARARELAEELLEQNPLVLRYTRLLFTHELKKIAHEVLGYGLALEGLAAIDESTSEA